MQRCHKTPATKTVDISYEVSSSGKIFNLTLQTSVCRTKHVINHPGQKYPRSQKSSVTQVHNKCCQLSYREQPTLFMYCSRSSVWFRRSAYSANCSPALFARWRRRINHDVPVRRLGFIRPHAALRSSPDRSSSFWHQSNNRVVSVARFRLLYNLGIFKAVWFLMSRKPAKRKN